MKTIRREIFETNSSSTHSITIKETEKISNLCYDGILYTYNLSDLILKTDNGSSILMCKTQDEKAALLCNWLYALLDDQHISKEVFDEYVDKLKEELSYESIEFNKNSLYFSPCSEYGECLNYENLEEDFNKFMKIIFDDSKQIIETNEIW